MKITVISLGCSKNLVDSEILTAKLKDAGAELTTNMEDAEYVIVNTCGFIEDAKRESIDRVLEISEKGKRVILVGCLAQRYGDELRAGLPEVEAVFGTESWDRVLEHLNLKCREEGFQRIVSTGRAFAYLKIAEGCNRKCSFCAIPLIRGKHRSRRMEDILDEARFLADAGVKEINIVSQDTTFYGRDLYGRNRLIDLLRELEKIEGIRWIRLLYLYPTEVTEDLIKFVADSEKVLPYFDIPVQHISDGVLKSMRRGYGRNLVMRMIETIYRVIGEPVLRTTLIVGYPAESRRDFIELLEFIKEGHFHWVGVFEYSHEEGTHAFGLGDPVASEEKEERRISILEEQRRITIMRNKSLIGKELVALIDGYSEEFSFVPVGRSFHHAPEVDGKIFLETDSLSVKPGDMVNIIITRSHEYDLVGKINHLY